MNRAPAPRIYSVGHSHHNPDQFLSLLSQAGITAVADVRSSPFSQRLPQFNRPELERLLPLHGITYVFLGDQLGGRPGDLGLYDENGRVDYERMRATELFRLGLERLLQGAERFRIAMLCAEEDPLDCHRGLMIAPALAERGVPPVHLRGNGAQEMNVEMEQRLLAETGVGTGVLDGLFACMVSDEERRQLLEEAYRHMARRKAFRLQPGDRVSEPNER